MTRIINFEPRFLGEFKALNLEWLDKYGLTEEADLVMINRPQEEILDKGGFIFLAQYEAQIAGTAALLKEGPEQFELAKIAVAPLFQGLGISRLLMEKCLLTARENAIKRIWLQSNSQLTTALHLYDKYGFKHIPVKNVHYQTADVMMELML